MDRHHLRLLVFAATVGFALEAAAFVIGSPVLFLVALALLAAPLAAGLFLALQAPGGRAACR